MSQENYLKNNQPAEIVATKLKQAMKTAFWTNGSGIFHWQHCQLSDTASQMTTCMMP